MYVYKNLFNLGSKDSIRFGIFQAKNFLKMNNHLGRVSPSHFLQNVLIETPNVCFKKTFKFCVFYFAISWYREV